ncbi:hypothetical protein BDK51DRAFT_42717 [Blyttiomyces helicus]|uniref:Uncharacterized protein n=1 Tax=Blyttiomyces helicus TaxID=388810 RepID=A0A4P9WAA7_9FUNG|nr:hypothetical protein BDK51DRAFT_42717 [Blyttiomyces helicus]|eukprot:RKO88433.1 hypothetical protein BDK51DRAFT_42717 [Blyttiomyces helicus]
MSNRYNPAPLSLSRPLPPHRHASSSMSPLFSPFAAEPAPMRFESLQRTPCAAANPDLRLAMVVVPPPLEMGYQAETLSAGPSIYPSRTASRANPIAPLLTMPLSPSPRPDDLPFTSHYPTAPHIMPPYGGWSRAGYGREDVGGSRERQRPRVSRRLIKRIDEWRSAIIDPENVPPEPILPFTPDPSPAIPDPTRTYPSTPPPADPDDHLWEDLPTSPTLDQGTPNTDRPALPSKKDLVFVAGLPLYPERTHSLVNPLADTAGNTTTSSSAHPTMGNDSASRVAERDVVVYRVLRHKSGAKKRSFFVSAAARDGTVRGSVEDAVAPDAEGAAVSEPIVTAHIANDEHPPRPDPTTSDKGKAPATDDSFLRSSFDSYYAAPSSPLTLPLRSSHPLATSSFAPPLSPSSFAPPLSPSIIASPSTPRTTEADPFSYPRHPPSTHALRALSPTSSLATTTENNTGSLSVHHPDPPSPPLPMLPTRKPSKKHIIRVKSKPRRAPSTGGPSAARRLSARTAAPAVRQQQPAVRQQQLDEDPGFRVLNVRHVASGAAGDFSALYADGGGEGGGEKKGRKRRHLFLRLFLRRGD